MEDRLLVTECDITKYHVGEISGSHGSRYEDDCLLVCCAL
jgi:hypothetical protein